MTGISSKALSFGGAENKKKYNGIEYDSSFGIDQYEAQLRNLDPQVGRWWEIDPKTDNQEMWSPYVSNNDNPITYSDPLGDEGESCCGGIWNAIVSGVDWINHNLNPVYGIFNGINSQFTHKDFLNGTPMTHGDGATDAVLSIIPGGKEIKALIKPAEKFFVKEVVETVDKQVVKGLGKYEVGTADNLAEKSIKGDGLDIHHVPQSKPASQVIKGYDKTKAPAIALPQAEHKAIPTLKGTNTAGSARQQLAKDIKDLRNNTNAPNSSLQKVIELNKKLFTEILKKPN